MLAATTMLSGCRQGLAKMRPAAGTQAPPDDLTVIITTSPTPSNPSLDCFEFLMETFQKVPPLVACRKIICCDGCKIIDGDRCYFRAGQVSEEALGLYSEYMDHLQDRVSLAATDPTDAFFNSELLRLDERQGFGFAVKCALKSVKTRFVIVVQHDRVFQKSFDLCELLENMRASPDELKFVCLSNASVLNYAHKCKSRFRVDIKPFERQYKGHRLLPMLQWLDSTHVAETEWYRNFVFNPKFKLVKKGGFIEDKFGQAQVKKLEEKGFPEGWAPFNTWLYCEPPDSAGYVGHIDGRAFKNEEKAEDGRQRQTVASRLAKLKVSFNAVK